MKLSDLAYDPKVSINGVWITYPGTEIQALTARMHNPPMIEWIDAKRRENVDPITGEVSDKVLDEIIFEACVRFVCLDLRNVEGEDGNPLTYNIDTARELFQSRNAEYGHFWNWWLAESRQKERFLAKTIHEQAKKQSASSDGSGSGEATSTSSARGTKKTASRESSPSSRNSNPTVPSG